MKRYFYVTSILVCCFGVVHSNNIEVSNGRVEGVNASEGYALVAFDLSWENSWRVTADTGNWDAAWVFLKYRVPGGAWQHAWLHENGHSSGTGTASVLEVGLKDDKLAFNASTNPGIGIIIYRSADGTGTFSATNVQFRWNYGVQGLPGSGNEVELKIFAVEMVLVDGGVLRVGDETSAGCFRQIGSNKFFTVWTTGSAMKCENTSFDDAQLEVAGIWVDGDGGISRSAETETDMNADFPTGFRGFYCMKYEISQGQYRDFLNTLTRDQQNLRTATNISGTSVTNRYVMVNSGSVQWRNGLRCEGSLSANDPIEVYCDLDGDGVKNESNDGECLACNFLSWADGVAYLDWSGLRPMTELEFEKAGRSWNGSIVDDFPWGTWWGLGAQGIATSEYTLSNAGQSDEGISTNYSETAGNANWSSTSGSIDGPVRVGIFAANSLNVIRRNSGAGYYGAMELGGNLSERAVTLGNATGRNFTGLHGDGLLSAIGNADVSNWPGTNAVGAGFRGGTWWTDYKMLCNSDRSSAANSNPHRFPDVGFRGVRSVGASGGGY